MLIYMYILRLFSIALSFYRSKTILDQSKLFLKGPNCFGHASKNQIQHWKVIIFVQFLNDKKNSSRRISPQCNRYLSWVNLFFLVVLNFYEFSRCEKFSKPKEMTQMCYEKQFLSNSLFISPAVSYFHRTEFCTM